MHTHTYVDMIGSLWLMTCDVYVYETYTLYVCLCVCGLMYGCVCMIIFDTLLNVIVCTYVYNWVHVLCVCVLLLCSPWCCCCYVLYDVVGVSLHLVMMLSL